MTQQDERLERPGSLRDAIRERIAAELESGKIAPGAGINLARLAAALNVSPTPVREALTQLQSEGLVVAEANRGFFAPTLTGRHLEEAYPILAALESLAVRTIAAYRTEDIARLRAVNGTFMSPDLTPLKALEADRSWHEQLVHPCANRTLLAELARIRRRIAPAELSFMRDVGQRPESVSDHATIISALEKGQTLAAVDAIERHWQRSSAFVRVREQESL